MSQYAHVFSYFLEYMVYIIITFNIFVFSVNFYHIWVCFCWMFFLVTGPIFLLFCMYDNCLLDAKHCELYLVYWIFLNKPKYFWALFWDTLKLFRNSLIFLRLSFKLSGVASEQPLFPSWVFPVKANALDYSTCYPVYCKVFPLWLVVM